MCQDSEMLWEMTDWSISLGQALTSLESDRLIHESRLPMPSKIRCISCEKRFSSHQALEHHLNHPSTSCRPWMDDVVRVSELLGNADQSQIQRSPPLQDAFMQDGEELPNFDWEPNDRGGLNEHDPPSNCHHDVPPTDSDTGRHQDRYPFAARVYGKGHTFMDVFDADPHADKRVENLYYPFASKQDWEMASWLLQSGLSMPAINQFLHLELVSYILHRPLSPHILIS